MNPMIVLAVTINQIIRFFTRFPANVHALRRLKHKFCHLILFLIGGTDLR